MSDSNSETEQHVASLLSHPLVLHAAWRKLQSWYRFGELRNEADYTAWKLNPEARLETLGKELARGDYKPSRFPLIPYPKKGGVLRHYTAPKVEDQVAFLVFGVLLAPVLEARMPNFSFGNRWFRGIYRDNREDEAQWKDRGFSLSDSRLYQPYARAFGLYRRVAHWSAAEMLSAPINRSGATGDALTPDDYPDEKLPPFVERRWWDSKGHKAFPRAFWASLDLRLAFPSVCVDELRRRLKLILNADETESGSYFGKLKNLESWQFGLSKPKNAAQDTMAGYPRAIRNLLSKPEVYQQLAGRLCDLLGRVGYRAPGVQEASDWDELWAPPHAEHDLPRADGGEHPGLPTGLAISNFLLNVYLTPVDRRYLRWLNDEAGGPDPECSVFLRFADDMLLVSPTREQLVKGVSKLWDGIAGEHDDSPAGHPGTGDMRSNLRLNWAKIGPEPVKELFEAYLCSEGSPAEQCGDCEEYFLEPTDAGESPAGDLERESKSGPGESADAKQTNEAADSSDDEENGEEEGSSCPTFVDWYENEEIENQTAFFDEYGEHVLREARLGPFVTYLVERMSDLAREGFEERFGQPARERLVQLQELIRFDFDDQQVREDTRRAFAANRLVRAWLPEEDAEEDSKQIDEIRRSVRQTVSESPWKFHLWRAVIRAAVRRPMAGEFDAEDEERRASEWLEKMLEEIRCPDSDDASTVWKDKWLARWSPGCGEDKSAPVAERRLRLFLSFLRAYFWRCLARTIAALRYEQERRLEARDPSTWEPMETRSPRSFSWLFRAVPSAEIPRILDWLGNVDRWVEVLYPTLDSDSPPRIRPWEADALAQAVLATTTRASLTKSLKAVGGKEVFGNRVAQTGGAQDDSPRLVLPDHEGLFGDQPLARAVLRRGSQLGQRAGDSTELRPWTLLKLVPGTGDEPPSELTHALGDLARERDGLFLAARLGMLFHLPEELAQDWYREPDAGGTSRLRLEFFEKVFGDSVPEGEGVLLERYHRLRAYAHLRRFLHSLNLYGPDAQPQLLAELQPTIHRVLWGLPTGDENLAGWDINLPEAPTIGLPMRVALAMFRDALQESVEKPSSEGNAGEKINRSSYPPTWIINRPEDIEGSRELSAVPSRILARGRRHQRSEISGELPDVSLENDKWIHTADDPDAWEVLPHPLYFLPLVLKDAEEDDYFSTNYRNWVHALHFFVAVEGSERFLDRVFDNGFGVVPFQDRWWLRRHIHLSPSTWKPLENLMRWLEDGGGELSYQQSKLGANPVRDLIDRLDALGLEHVGARDFLYERVDVRLEVDEDQEEVRAIRGFPPPPLGRRPLPEELKLESLDDLDGSLPVRIGQLDAGPDWSTLRHRFPAFTRQEIQNICHQVWMTVTRGENGKFGPSGSSGGLVVLPELVVPSSETGYLRSIVRKTGRSVLAGLTWQPLRCVTPPHAKSTVKKRFIVNEAVLIVPIADEESSEYRLTREFRIRKPTPAHLEHGFAEALNATTNAGKAGSGPTFQLLPGRKWYRFLHPDWGDFTVGICADLLDPAPWMNLRGEILHLVLSAFNKDVELYDKLSWIRAYESYANVVVGNHGSYGGSFAWSPKHRSHKELARIRGNHLHVVADVELPVRALARAQQNGVERAVEASKQEWMGSDSNSDDQFKSPPPSFDGREE